MEGDKKLALGLRGCWCAPKLLSVSDGLSLKQRLMLASIGKHFHVYLYPENYIQ